MITKLFSILFLALVLAACVPVIETETAEALDFNAPIVEITPMSYADVLCCYQCNG